MGLTTLLGRVQLDVQDAIRSAVIGAKAPNLIVVSLCRDNVTREFGSTSTAVINRIRFDLESSIHRMLQAHSWAPGGCGTLSINLFVRQFDAPSQVRISTVREFARFQITDDRGVHGVSLTLATALIGRAHIPVPPGFIPIYDSLRLVSRRHFRFEYKDLGLSATILGRNMSTLNDNPLTHGEQTDLEGGDVLRCGACGVLIESIERGIA